MSRRIPPGLLSLWSLAALSCFALPHQADGHSASDAYLTLTADAVQAPGQSTLHGQWDVALRDLDFVLKLDDDGDGRLTWGKCTAIKRRSSNMLIGILPSTEDPATPAGSSRGGN